MTKTPRTLLDLDGVSHGNGSTYNNHGCRCDPCTEAHRIRKRAYRQRIAESGPRNRIHIRGSRQDSWWWVCDCGDTSPLYVLRHSAREAAAAHRRDHPANQPANAWRPPE